MVEKMVESVINRFINDLPLHLNPDGRVQLVQSSLSNVEETIGNVDGNRF